MEKPQENTQIETLGTVKPSSPLPPPGSDDPRDGAEDEKKETKLVSPTAASLAAGGGGDIEKKIRRAERFGMPVQLSEEEKRRTRAERFGTGNTPLHGAKDGGILEEQKRKARAERFGLVVHTPSDEEAKKKARLERFSEKPKAKPNTLEEEKMKARAARFSQTSSPSKTNGNAQSGAVGLCCRDRTKQWLQPKRKVGIDKFAGPAIINL